MLSNVKIEYALPFVIWFILEKPKSPEVDFLHSKLPDKKEKFKNWHFYTLVLLPLLLLLNKGSSSQILEHTAKIFTLTSIIKMISFMSKKHDVESRDMFNALSLSCSLMLIYDKIISRDKFLIPYIYNIFLSLYLIIMRKTTTENIILDWILVHFVFFFTK